MELSLQAGGSGFDNGSTLMNMTSPPETGVNHVVMVVYNVYLCLVMVLGLPGNTLVLVVFAKHKPNTTTDWFILFITLCDFVTLFLNVPVYITFSTGLWSLYGNTAICLVHMFVSQSVVLSSSFLICGLALDRYIRVCRPMMFYSTRRARNTCITISIVTTVLSIPCFVLFENRKGSCRVNSKVGLFTCVYYAMVFLTFVAAAIVVVFSYIKVNSRIKKTEAVITRHNNAQLASLNLKGSRIFVIGKRNQVVPACENSIANTERIVKHFVRFDVENEKIKGDNCVTKTTVDESGRSTNQKASGSDKNSVASIPSATTSVRLSAILRTRNGYRQASILTTKISFLVCGVFITSWIPPWTAFIVYSIGCTFRVEVLLFTRMAYLLNTASNPILYAWFNRKFRNHMTDILCFNRR